PLAYYLQENFNILILYGEKEADEVEASFLLKQYPNLNTQKAKYLRRTINPVIDVLAFFALVKQIKQHKAVVVHTHGSKSGFLGRLAAWVLRVPVIVHTFHGHLFHSYFNSITTSLIQFTEKWLAKISTAIIALSTKQANELTAQYNIVPINKLHIVSLGVDERNLVLDIEKNRTQFRNKYHLAENDIAVGIIGRLVPIKNHLLFLQIAEQILLSGVQNIYFFIVGDGDSKKELTSYLNMCKIVFNNDTDEKTSAKIIFTSWIEDMTSVYHGLDMVVLTSLNEGTPLSIIEAQFCGKPIIANNVGGVKDTFENGISGYLVNGTNVTDYVSKISLLANNAELRNSMSQQAIKFASSTFNKQQEVQTVKNIYLQLLSSR
ncbi:MAG: glycosyltransferase, partial [Chitinophagaceae bacterium]|nr:glycosyltransferase [Chitinophagaceae bacterium]